MDINPYIRGDNLKFLINDLATLFGLSNQTLHYYEKKGMLHPERDVINDYRYYHASDLSLLGALKKYRNAEFSLKDVDKLCHDSNEDDVILNYVKQKEKLTKEIEKKQCVVKKVEEELKLCNDYKENGSAIRTEKLEGFLRFESIGTEIIFQDKKMQNEAIPWFENIFFTDAAKIFNLKDEGEDTYQYSYGMIATKSMANYLKLNVTENVKVIEEGYFVTSTINSKYERDSNKTINRCMDYINENKFTTRGNPFSKTIFYYKNKNSRERISQILIPVNNKCE